MSLKTVYAPHLGREVKFGRRRSALGAIRRPRLADYVTDLQALPVPPPVASYTAKALSALHEIDGNDELGDCVVAGGYHVEATATGNATGTPYQPTLAQIIADYSKIGGYVPNDPNTDNGCDLVTAMNYWMKTGFANGTRLAGWLAVNPLDPNEMRLAIYLFENLYMGLGLPDAWIDPVMPSGDGFTWDVAGAADPYNGHCIIAAGYDSRGMTIDTWGMLGTLTWPAASKYLDAKAGGESYVLLTPDMLAKGASRAPNGFDWSQLCGDFNALGGHVPIPVPTPPPPTPVPVPPAPPVHTMQQAQMYAMNGIASRAPQIIKEMQLAASDGISAGWGR